MQLPRHISRGLRNTQYFSGLEGVAELSDGGSSPALFARPCRKFPARENDLIYARSLLRGVKDVLIHGVNHVLTQNSKPYPYGTHRPRVIPEGQLHRPLHRCAGWPGDDDLRKDADRKGGDPRYLALRERQIIPVAGESSMLMRS